jgi:RNA polymerase sigma factor (sigma-70 family)
LQGEKDILQTDQALVQSYKNSGNLETLGTLYSQYMELIYGVCLKYLKQSDDAKDAVINIFEELIVKVKKYEIDNFRGWLYQLAKNHCLMKLRSQKKYPINVDIDLMHLQENVHLEDVKEKEQDLTIMEQCIETLPKEQKLTVELFYLKEKCYKEIAETINIDITKVRSFIQNGRRNLKICMDKKALQRAN